MKSGVIFSPNHFVPLIFKSKLKAGKRKLQLPAKSVKIPKQKEMSKPSISSYFDLKSSTKLSTPSATSSSSAGVNTKLSKPSATSSSAAGVTTYAAVIDSGDVAFYREIVKGLNNLQIQNLIRSLFKPEKTYVFPKTSDGRHFNYDWFSKFPWLSYSPSQDGAFCLSCVLFGDNFPKKASRIKKLFSEPFKNWKNATCVFRQHTGESSATFRAGLHFDTFHMLTSILNQMSGKTQPIDMIVDEHTKKIVAENRKKLIPIVDTIKLCGRLCLPLRGHRDDSKYHPEVGSYSSGGVGNFVELLNFRARAGDKVLEDHLKNCGKNSSYISKNIQNDLIMYCGQVISDAIITDVKKSKFFSIIADEAADVSNKEQMSLVLRFVDEQSNIREDFVRFIHCQWGLSGENLATAILGALQELGLNIDDCRGQGYDGAGAVAGHINGLSAQLLRINEKAIYTHCYSHRLNLAICESTKVTPVRNVLAQIKELSYFFNFSQSRQILLERNIDHYAPSSRKTKLKDVCRTRWIERVTGMDTFEELFVPLFHTLTEMSLNLQKQCNPATATKASSFLTLISNFTLIVALVIARNVLDMTLPVTQLLQDKSIDIMDGIGLIESLKNLGMSVRNEIDFYHDNWYNKAVLLAGKVEIEESVPRTTGRQTCRDNHPFTDASEYYKRTITMPMIDHLNSSLETRFNVQGINAYNGLSIIPSKMLSLLKKHGSISWKKNFRQFLEFYQSDLPNPLGLDAELELWERYWLNYKSIIPATIATTLKSLNFSGFQNIKLALHILGTLPITSCECVRSFSAMRRLKNYTRSTMIEERLNGLALMHI